MEFDQILKFIRELYKKPNGFIPLHAPIFNGNEKKYLIECIDTTFVSSVGQFVDKFEEGIAKFTGAKKGVSCVNGTNALYLALKLVGVENNTEVITQPLTFIATANAINYCGAEPIFLDVDIDTMGLSPLSLKIWLEKNAIRIKNKEITINKKTGKRISACVPMHTFGHPCKIDEIVRICNSYYIPVVEDAAESLGSIYKGRHTGTFGKIGVLSFNGNKILTTGGGGMLILNNEELAQKAKHLTTQAKISHPWEFVHDAIGYNYRMPNINAALGLAQLEQLPIFLKSKRIIAEKYKLFFSKLKINFIIEPNYSKANYWLNAILFDNMEERDAFLKYSNENGIMTRPVWKLINKLPMYKDCQKGNLYNSEWLSDRLVNLPSSPII
jgi:aminotransferase in exopolysaccharide biosynthesis